MSQNSKTCPICPRGCDLSAPHCGRGEEYAKTGKLPENGKNGHKHGYEHGPLPRLQFERKEEQLVMKYLHHAVGIADRGGFTQEDAEKMSSVLTELETTQLAEILEKLSNYWRQIAPQKPAQHDRS